MILFYGEGRFGNQMFQYQALSRIASGGEKILAVGLEDLRDYLDLLGPRLAVVTRLALLKRAVKYLLLPLVLRPLVRTLRLANYVEEIKGGMPPHFGYSGKLRKRRGAIRRLTLVDGGYFHDASLWTSLFPLQMTAVNGRLQEKARDYLDSALGIGVRPAFVHVRRGDYSGYKAYGVNDLMLPVEYYRSALSELQRRVGRKPIVLLTDDPDWTRLQFPDIADALMPELGPELDFAVMTECSSGVLSNSTFSLAAALMIRDPELIIAPRFWFGFQAGQWLPPSIEIRHERFVYLSIPSASTNP
jgi:hypothetical protein